MPFTKVKQKYVVNSGDNATFLLKGYTKCGSYTSSFNMRLNMFMFIPTSYMKEFDYIDFIVDGTSSGYSSMKVDSIKVGWKFTDNEDPTEGLVEDGFDYMSTGEGRCVTVTTSSTDVGYYTFDKSYFSNTSYKYVAIGGEFRRQISNNNINAYLTITFRSSKSSKGLTIYDGSLINDDGNNKPRIIGKNFVKVQPYTEKFKKCPIGIYATSSAVTTPSSTNRPSELKVDLAIPVVPFTRSFDLIMNKATDVFGFYPIFPSYKIDSADYKGTATYFNNTRRYDMDTLMTRNTITKYGQLLTDYPDRYAGVRNDWYMDYGFSVRDGTFFVVIGDSNPNVGSSYSFLWNAHVHSRLLFEYWSDLNE